MDSLRLFSLRPRNPSWIWIRYIQYATHRNNFMSSPKLAMSMRCLIPLPVPSSHFTSRQRLSPKPPDTQNSLWLQSLFPPTANKTFAKLRRTQFLARPTIRATFSTLSYLHFVSLYLSFSRGLQHKHKPNIPCCQ